MRSGRLRHRVSVQRRSTVKDAHGQPLDTWTAIASRRASIEPLNGKEYIAAAAENSEVSTRITLRYESLLSDLSSNDRVVHGLTIYELVSPPIVPGLRNRMIILMCKVID